MNQKIVQYLNEAHASEMALVRVLQSQIAMMPRGSYRRAIEKHLTETRSHAERLQQQLAELDAGSNPLHAGIGLIETAVGQVLALSKTPFDLLRGTSGEEKVLKNAKDTCATEALEIATYQALEELAVHVGDDETAKLARVIRREEERMLERVQKEIPALVDAVARAEFADDPSYDPTRTGAADAVRRTARTTAKRAGAAEPWRGYDKATVEDIRKRLERADDELARNVRRYERAHKNRAGVIEATERELTPA